jgi:hypothetical protein
LELELPREGDALGGFDLGLESVLEGGYLRYADMLIFNDKFLIII